jgi:folate-binding protein YgfZ
LEAEYQALVAGAALVDRSCRCWFEAHGADRHAWLHNLTTNQVKTLGQNEGVYAFALNSQGRIQFDLNIINSGESLWIDIDRRFRESALKHLNKYIITEDVSLSDRTDKAVRIGLCGPAAIQLLTSVGVPQARAMPTLGLSTAHWRGQRVSLIRHDFCGVFGVELFLPVMAAIELWPEWTAGQRNPRVQPVGQTAVQVHRIEAGIPWPGHEITGEYLPAETRQLDRAVSHTKGCYLGQEVVERMRSRNVVARQLCVLRFEGERVPPNGTQILSETGQLVGAVTSACTSLASGESIGLGYVKTAHATGEAKLRAEWEGPDGPDKTMTTLSAQLAGSVG